MAQIRVVRGARSAATAVAEIRFVLYDDEALSAFEEALAGGG